MRALQGPPGEAAALAGQGDAHHPQRTGEDGLFRGCPPRILRHAHRLPAVPVEPRPYGEAQVRHPDAHLLRDDGARVRVGGALLLRASPELRPHADAWSDDAARPDDEGGVASSHDHRSLRDPRCGRLPVGPRCVPRTGQPGIQGKHSNGRRVLAERSLALGLGRDGSQRQVLHRRLQHGPEHLA